MNSLILLFVHIFVFMPRIESIDEPLVSLPKSFAFHNTNELKVKQKLIFCKL
jgi:hypothetical protein